MNQWGYTPGSLSPAQEFISSNRSRIPKPISPKVTSSFLEISDPTNSDKQSSHEPSLKGSIISAIQSKYNIPDNVLRYLTNQEEKEKYKVQLLSLEKAFVSALPTLSSKPESSSTLSLSSIPVSSSLLDKSSSVNIPLKRPWSATDESSNPIGNNESSLPDHHSIPKSGEISSLLLSYKKDTSPNASVSRSLPKNNVSDYSNHSDYDIHPPIMCMVISTFFISQAESLASTLLPITNWPKIYDTLRKWNKIDDTVPQGFKNSDLLVLLISLRIGLSLSKHRIDSVSPDDPNIQDIPLHIIESGLKPGFCNWLDDLIHTVSQRLYLEYPCSFDGIDDITGYLLHAYYLCYDESTETSSSWSKIAMFTSTFQRLGFDFASNSLIDCADASGQGQAQSLNQHIKLEQQSENWIYTFKITEKLIAYSMRTPSLVNTTFFPPLLDVSTFSTGSTDRSSSIASSIASKTEPNYLLNTQSRSDQTWLPGQIKSAASSNKAGCAELAEATRNLGNKNGINSIYSHLVYGKANFVSIRIALLELVDSILTEIYSHKHNVDHKKLSYHENVVKKLAKTFTDSVILEMENKDINKDEFLNDPKINYQLLTIQSLCNTVVLLIYRPYIISTQCPLVATELYRRKAAAVAIGAIATMLRFVDSGETHPVESFANNKDPSSPTTPNHKMSESCEPANGSKNNNNRFNTTYETYKWFSWNDICVAAFQACVLLIIDHQSRQHLQLDPDINILLKQFAVCLFSEVEGKEAAPAGCTEGDEQAAQFSTYSETGAPNTPFSTQGSLNRVEIINRVQAVADQGGLSASPEPYYSRTKPAIPRVGNHLSNETSHTSGSDNTHFNVNQTQNFPSMIPAPSASSSASSSPSLISPAASPFGFPGQNKFPLCDFCWSKTDTNWRLSLVEKCRVEFLKMSGNDETSRPGKAAAILTAMLSQTKTVQIPRLFGPLNTVVGSGSKANDKSARQCLSKAKDDNGEKDDDEANPKYLYTPFYTKKISNANNNLDLKLQTVDDLQRGSSDKSKNGTQDAKYLVVKYDPKYFESLVSKSAIQFEQRIATAINDFINN